MKKIFRNVKIFLKWVFCFFIIYFYFSEVINIFSNSFIQSAAKLRPRHRAKSESEETINHLSGSSIWRPLGGGLGGLLGRLESQDGSKLGPKREVFGVPKRSENGCIIGSLLGSTFS